MFRKVLRKHGLPDKREYQKSYIQLIDIMELCGNFYQFLSFDNLVEPVLTDCFEILKDYYKSSLKADLFFLQVDEVLKNLQQVELKPWNVLTARLQKYHAEKMNAERVEFIKGLKALYFPDMVHFWREITYTNDEEIIRTAIGIFPKEWEQEHLRLINEELEYEKGFAEAEKNKYRR